MRADGWRPDRSHIHYLTSCFYWIFFRFDEKSTAKSTANLFCCPLTSLQSGGTTGQRGTFCGRLADPAQVRFCEVLMGFAYGCALVLGHCVPLLLCLLGFSGQ